MHGGRDFFVRKIECIGALVCKGGERHDLAIVVAFRIWICSPIAGAASCTSRNEVSVLDAWLD